MIDHESRALLARAIRAAADILDPPAVEDYGDALSRACPACGAAIGVWCCNVCAGAVHPERAR